MPTWQIILLQPARRYLDSLPSEQRERGLDALGALQEDPLHSKLQGKVHRAKHGFAGHLSAAGSIPAASTNAKNSNHCLVPHLQ